MRKVLIGVAVIVLAVALVIVIGPQLIPADRLKQDIARQVESATGRQLAIDGELSFTLLPAPGVSVGGVRLSNVDGAATPDMLRLRRATVVVALLPLLGGAIEVDRIILVEPQIELEQLADGRASWQFTPRSDATAAPGADGRGGAQGGGAAPQVQLNNLVIDNGTLTFRDGDTVETVTGIDMVMMAQSLQGPFRLEGGVTARGVPLRLQAAVGELAVDRAIPVSLSVGAEGIGLDVNGVVSGYPNEPRLAGSVGAKIADAGVTMAALTGEPAPGLLGGRPVAFDGTLAASLAAANVSVNDLSVRFGDVNATGALDVGVGAAPRIDLVLNAGQVDLDALLATVGGKPAPARPAGGSGGPGGGKRAAGATDEPEAPGLPAGIAGTVELKVENVLYRGGVVRQARLAAELANGALTISQLSAQLPGGSDVSLFGFVDAPKGAPAFGGQIEANSDNLRALLAWLDIDVGAVPAERLRKLAASAAIKADARNVTVTDLDLAIDTMRVRGGIAVALRDRPGFGIGLSLDRINLDAYLPHHAEAAAARRSDGAGEPAAGSAAGGPAGAPGAFGGDGGTGLAVLDTFDAIVQAKVGEVTYRGTTIRGVNLDATLQGGNLDLRDASVASLAGAKARFAGTLGGIAGTPRADLTLSVDAANADGLLKLAGVTAPVSIGAAKLDGSLTGDFDGLKLDLALQALQATANVAGTLKQPLAAPAYDLSLKLGHADAARLFALLAGEAPGSATLGAFALDGTLAGTADAALFDVVASVGDGSAALKGQLAGFAAGAAAGNVSLQASHPDLAGLVRAFAPDYRPALAALGPFEINTAATVEPQAIRLAAVEGTAGPVAWKGSAELALQAPRPKLTASLATSEIIVDWFLPASGGAAGAGGSPGANSGDGRASAVSPPPGERWSHDPIDVAPLRALDADISLAASAITYAGIKVDGPKLAATLADGTLDLHDLSGEAFGGTFGMTGQVVAADTPRVRYTMTVADTDAAAFVNAGQGAGQGGPAMLGALELLFPVASLKIVSGKLGAEIDVAAQGHSQFELVSNLAGRGAMTLTDAVVDGIDACRVSEQLNHLNGLEGFLALVGSARGGQTRVANFSGGYTLDRGIATLPQQTVSADCGTATFAGKVDLPRWTIDLTARATFPEHRRFPGLVIEQKGPLDAPNTRLVNSNAVQEYIIGNAAESVIRKLVPQAPAGPSQGSQPQGAPPQPAKPADQFRNLLEGLIRK